jgi:hypothetical protein
VPVDQAMPLPSLSDPRNPDQAREIIRLHPGNGFLPDSEGVPLAVFQPSPLSRLRKDCERALLVGVAPLHGERPGHVAFCPRTPSRGTVFYCGTPTVHRNFPGFAVSVESPLGTCAVRLAFNSSTAPFSVGIASGSAWGLVAALRSTEGAYLRRRDPVAVAPVPGEFLSSLERTMTAQLTTQRS